MQDGSQGFIRAFLDEIEHTGSIYDTLMEDLKGDHTPEVWRALAFTHTKLEEAELWAGKALALAEDAIRPPG